MLNPLKQSHLLSAFIILLTLSCISPALAGDYLDSAHGDSNNGVNDRATGYIKGNCGHCHEQHASVGGSEPDPDDSGPSPFTLFTKNFDTTTTSGPGD